MGFGFINFCKKNNKPTLLKSQTDYKFDGYNEMTLVSKKYIVICSTTVNQIVNSNFHVSSHSSRPWTILHCIKCCITPKGLFGKLFSSPRTIAFWAWINCIHATQLLQNYIANIYFCKNWPESILWYFRPKGVHEHT